MRSLILILVMQALMVGSVMAANLERFNWLFTEELKELRSGTIPNIESNNVLAVNSMNIGHGWVAPTPGQPTGPFYPIRMPQEIDTDLTKTANGLEASGVKVVVQGQVMDESGQIIQGATVEIWQACNTGKYNHERDRNPAIADPNFQYYGRTTSDLTGKYIFITIVPGPYPANENWWRPPHIHLIVQSPGYQSITTQIYFDGNSFPEPVSIVNGREVTGIEINAYNNRDLILSKLSSEAKARLIVQFQEVMQDNRSIKIGVFNLYLRRN